jgi:hypothetical protein
MKKSLLLWVALMASTSALAAENKEIRFGVDPTLRRLNGKIRRVSWRVLILTSATRFAPSCRRSACGWKATSTALFRR